MGETISQLLECSLVKGWQSVTLSQQGQKPWNRIIDVPCPLQFVFLDDDSNKITFQNKFGCGNTARENNRNKLLMTEQRIWDHVCLELERGI
jgi:hypothetical protein